MYNRYIPQPDGSYRRSRQQGPEDQQPAPVHCPPPKKEPDECREPELRPSAPRPDKHHGKRGEQSRAMPAGSFLRQLLPKDLDTGDLIVILLLLLMAGDCQEDRNTAMLTLALYLFM